MSDVESSPLGGARARSKPAHWDRTRLGVPVPLCLVVVVAIACIVVAALTSAQRAGGYCGFRDRLDRGVGL